MGSGIEEEDEIDFTVVKMVDPSQRDG